MNNLPLQTPAMFCIVKTGFNFYHYKSLDARSVAVNYGSTRNMVDRYTENTAEHSGAPDSGAVFTIGHSNAPLENLLSLLHENAIQVLVDVRSSPYSRHVPQANREPLEAALRDSGLKYLFMGEQLGGHPEGISVRDITGSLDYAKLADSERFREGLRRLMSGVAQYRVCLLCSEEDPARCHRGLLIGKELKKRGVDVRHIRHTGQVESQVELEARLTPVQKTLFPEM